MPVSLTIRKLARQTFWLIVLLGISAVAHAGLNVTESDVAEARKAETEATREADRAQDRESRALDQFREAQAKADAVKKDIDQLKDGMAQNEKTVEDGEQNIATAKQRLQEATNRIEAAEQEIRELEEQLRRARREASETKGQASVPSQQPLQLTKTDGFMRHHPGVFPKVIQQFVQAEENAQPEAAAEDQEADEASQAEPGWLRKRALRRGDEPKTPGEVKWLAEWKAEQEAEAKAEAEKAAQAAKDKAEAEARRLAEAEAASTRKAEEAAAASTRKAEEAAQKAEEAAEQAQADANAEPGFFRKRALRDGAEPNTPGEVKWLAEWKAEQDAEAKAAAEKAAQAAKDKAEEEARRQTDTAAEIKRKAEEAEQQALAEANAEPGFLRKRALRGGAEAETPGEVKWLAEWKAEQEAAQAEEARVQAEKEAREAAEVKRKELEAQRKDEERAQREAEKIAQQEAELQQKAAEEARKLAEVEARRQQEEALRQAQEAARAKARARLDALDKDIDTIRRRIDGKKLELVTVKREVREAESAVRDAERAISGSLRELNRDKQALPRMEANLAELQRRADSQKQEYETEAKFVQQKRNEAKQFADKADMLVRQLENGRRMMQLVLEAYDRYASFKGRMDEVEQAIRMHDQQAEYYKARIPSAKQAVVEATREVSEAREAYDLHRIRLQEDTASVEAIRRQILIIEEKDLNKPLSQKDEEQAQLDPLREEIVRAVERMRQVESAAIEVYRQADYHEYMAKYSRREKERMEEAFTQAKSEYDRAALALQPYGSLEEVDILRIRGERK